MAPVAGGDFGAHHGPTPTPTHSTNPSPAKRKSLNSPPPQAKAKRFRRDLHIEDVPVEIIQHCLSFLVPVDLAHVSATSRHFRDLLTDSQPDKSPPSPLRSSSLMRQDHNQVWLNARKNLEGCSLPQVPAPCAERTMWSLLAAKVCQFCLEKPVGPRTQDSGDDQTIRGPGPDIAQIIWPFGVVSCGPCLRREVMPFEKLSQTADAYWLHLVAQVLLSETGNVVLCSFEAERPPPPPGLRTVILKLELDSIIATYKTALPKSKYDSMKLDTIARMKLASTWEDWYINNPESSEAILRKARSIRGPIEIQNPKPRQQIRPFASSSAANEAKSPGPDDNSADGSSGRGASRPQSSSAIAGPQRRTPGPAQAAAAARKRQIEERCALLDPPIPADLLQYMDKFDAALKINIELTEEAWVALAPRLIAERPQAEQRRAEQHAHQALAARKSSREMSTADIKERYEMLQRPIRSRLGGFVDDFTKVSWADGQAINAGTARRFAAEVLANIKNRYDACRDSSKLKLDNLRWVVDNKVKPLTRAFHDDLFRCPSCPQEEVRYFSLEGLLQHQTSKHGEKYKYTRGGGKILFHEVDWPDEPPFYVADDFRRGRPAGRPTPLPNPNGPSGMQPPRPSTAYSQHSVSSHRYPDTSPATSPHPGPYAQGYPPPGYWAGPTSPAPSAMSYGYQAAYSQAHSPAPSWGTGWTPHENYNPFGGPPSHPVTPGPPHHQAHPYSGAPSPMSTSPMPFQGGNFLQAQIETLAQLSAEIYNDLNSIKQLPPSVRCFTLIHHVVSKFQGKFHNKPNLDLFANTLGDHHLMQPLKGINGLSCKTCSEGRSFAELRPSFYDLCLHFKSVHVEQASALRTAATHESGDKLGRADWTCDMIELPAESHISSLKTLSGMDETKLGLLRDAFPSIDFGDALQPPMTSAGYQSLVPAPSYIQPRQYGPPLDHAPEGPIYLGPVSYGYNPYQTIPGPPPPYVTPQLPSGGNVNPYHGLHSLPAGRDDPLQPYGHHSPPHPPIKQEAEYSPDMPTFSLSPNATRNSQSANTGRRPQPTNISNAPTNESVQAILDSLASQGNGAQGQNGPYPAGYRR